MALAAHLVRRTATYYWRRRLPAALGAKVLLISLRTSDPARARRLGPLVTAESNRAFDDFAAGKADYEAVLAHLQMVIRRESMDLPIEAAPRPAIARSEPIPARPKADPYGPALKALVRRLMDQKQAQGMSEAQISQMTKVYALFSEITGVRDIRQIKQAHIAQFVDVLQQLPPTYRKSPKDAKKPLSQIIAENKGPSGLSATTINRNLDYLNQLFTKARSEGFANVTNLGRALWRRWSGYHRRSRVETKMHCVKLLGQRLMARDFDRQVAELQVRIAVLNGYTALGIPVTEPVG